MRTNNMLQNYHRHIMNVKRIFEKFCMEVNVIGFKECYETKNIFVRLIWASCLSVGFIMTIYFMCSIVIDYRSNPTVTKVSHKCDLRRKKAVIFFNSDLFRS